MAYTPTVWKNGEFPPIDAEHLNKIEQGIADAVSVTPQTLSDEQKAQARGNIDAAPGGFGWGNSVGQFILDANEAILGGFYYWGPDAKNTPFRYGAMVVIPRSSSTNKPNITQIASQDTGDFTPHAFIAVRKSTDSGDGMWGPWEWVNPPMELGVEYRTTERYLGKPVYVKVVDCGACPADGYKDVIYGTTGIVLPIRCEGTWSYSSRSTIPFESSNEDQLHIGALGGAIRIKTGGKDFSSYTCIATVWYAKTTD